MPNPNRHHNYHTHHHATTTPPKPNPKLLSIFLKLVVMSIILIIFAVFLGLAAIVLLYLFLAGSLLQHRRHRVLLRNTHSPQTPPASSYSLHDLQNLLPPFRFTEFGITAGDGDCSICLENFKEGEFCRSLPVCEHVFHSHCVETWLTKVPSCPICRTRVRLDTGGPSDSVISGDECKFLWAIGVGR